MLENTVPKKATIKSAKAAAWRQFSHYIRLRDCYATTGDSYRGRCCTCNLEFDFSELEAGHFVPGRSRYVLFEERGVHAQCGKCNHKKPFGLDGNLLEYYPFMVKKYGQEVIDELKANKHKTGNWSIPELQDLEELYKHKTNELAANQP